MRLDPTARLGVLARLIRANRAPYYVRHPVPPALRKDFPTEGWYWIPEGHTGATFLARDVFDAYHRLMLLVEEEADLYEP